MEKLKTGADSLCSRDFIKKAVFRVLLGGLVIGGVQEASARITRTECTPTGSRIKKEICQNERGHARWYDSTGVVFDLNSYFGNGGGAEDCDVKITMDHNPRWNGPYNERGRDTYTSRDPETGRQCTKEGTFYYPDHTDSSPHYDRGEWKDGKKHGKITSVRGNIITHDVYDNDRFIGRWVSGQGHGKGGFRTAEELRQIVEARDARIAADDRRRAERARRRSNTSTSCHLENKGYVDSDERYSGTCSNTRKYVQCGPHYDNRYYCLTDQRGTHYGDTPQEALDGACGCD